MATKAERFNEQLAFEKHHTPKQRPHPKPAHATHNEAARAARHSAYELERSNGGARPSRKSSRKSANRQKHDSALRVTAVMKRSTPSERAARPTGNPN